MWRAIRAANASRVRGRPPRSGPPAAGRQEDERGDGDAPGGHRPLLPRDAREQPEDGDTGHEGYRAGAPHPEGRAARLSAAASELPRRETARSVQDEGREGRENGQLLEAVGDRERADDRALQGDGNVRRAKAGMDRGDLAGDGNVARQGEG